MGEYYEYDYEDNPIPPTEAQCDLIEKFNETVPDTIGQASTLIDELLSRTYERKSEEEKKRSRWIGSVKRKKRATAKLFGGCCQGGAVPGECMEEYNHSFAFHHLTYRPDEKTYRDFNNTWAYNEYVIPIVRSRPEDFMLLCEWCHSREEKIKKRIDVVRGAWYEIITKEIVDCKEMAEAGYTLNENEVREIIDRMFCYVTKDIRISMYCGLVDGMDTGIGYIGKYDDIFEGIIEEYLNEGVYGMTPEYCLDVVREDLKRAVYTGKT